MLILERPDPVEDLFDHITQRGPLSEATARDYMKQVNFIYNLHKLINNPIFFTKRYKKRKKIYIYIHISVVFWISLI